LYVSLCPYVCSVCRAVCALLFLCPRPPWPPSFFVCFCLRFFVIPCCAYLPLSSSCRPYDRKTIPSAFSSACFRPVLVNELNRYQDGKRDYGKLKEERERRHEWVGWQLRDGGWVHPVGSFPSSTSPSVAVWGESGGFVRTPARRCSFFPFVCSVAPWP